MPLLGVPQGTLEKTSLFSWRDVWGLSGSNEVVTFRFLSVRDRSDYLSLYSLSWSIGSGMGQSNDGLVRLRTRLLAEWCRKVMGLRDPCTMTEVQLEGEEESAKAQGMGPDGLCRHVVRIQCNLE